MYPFRRFYLNSRHANFPFNCFLIFLETNISHTFLKTAGSGLITTSKKS